MSGSEPWKKRIRNLIVKTSIEGFDVLFAGLEPEQRGELIFQAHFWVFLVGILYTVLFGRRFALQIALCIGILVLVQFSLLDGCILTRIEHHYRKEKGTVVDIFLRLFGLRVTNEHRYLITVIGYSIIVIGFLAIYIRECILGVTCA